MWLTDIRQTLGDSGATRIRVAQALRGTFAVAVPFLTLRIAGYPVDALFATLATISVSLADSGGPYRQRLAVMLLVTTIVPITMLAGMQTGDIWYLSTAIMFTIAMAGGMTYVLGTAAIPIGLQSGLGFLIGVSVPGSISENLQHLGVYLAGAAWTIFLALFIWRIRPYRRIRYQTAECFRQVAAVFALVEHYLNAPSALFERDLSDQQSRSREAQRQLEIQIGETLFSEQELPSAMTDFTVLLKTVNRLEAGALSLAGVVRSIPIDQLGPPGAPAITHALIQMRHDVQRISSLLLSNAPGSLTAARPQGLTRFQHADSNSKKSAGLEEIRAYLDACIRHIQVAERAAIRVVGAVPNQTAVMPPMQGPAFPHFHMHQLLSNLTFRSTIFLHSLRLAFATAAGTLLYTFFDIPHGIWLPLTTLLILQPHLGATLPRAFHRVAGTVVGAALASVLIIFFAGTPAIYVAVLVCVFFTIIFIRARYWVAVTFITPLIILLLDLLTRHPWQELIERIVNTLGGALIAIIAGFLLWPDPERRRLPRQLSEAVEANQRYIDAALSMVAGVKLSKQLEKYRAEAELATGNAEAALERMRAEPRHMRASSIQDFAMLTYLQRITRHITRLTVYSQERALQLRSTDAIRRQIDATLSSLAVALRTGGRNVEHLTADAARAELESELKEWKTHAPDVTAALAFQIGEVVDDVENLRNAYLEPWAYPI